MQVTKEISMSNSALENLALTGNDSTASVARTVTIALGVWLVAVSALAANGAFRGPPGAPPLAVFGGIVTPLIVFAIALRASAAFRAFALTLDLRLIVALQAWRWAGLGFVALYANHVLPGLFALPAGLGDMAVGAVAPWLVVSLARAPAVARSGGFRLWNTLGIVDLVVAVSMATICSLRVDVAGSASMAPMAELPLVLIPTFLVPLFVMLHVAALSSGRTPRP
jgi:hypothetical protein